VPLQRNGRLAVTVIVLWGYLDGRDGRDGLPDGMMPCREAIRFDHGQSRPRHAFQMFPRQWNRRRGTDGCLQVQSCAGIKIKAIPAFERPFIAQGSVPQGGTCPETLKLAFSTSAVLPSVATPCVYANLT